MQTFIHSHAQFEDDTLGNIQPVKVMVEDVTKTKHAPYYLLFTSYRRLTSLFIITTKQFKNRPNKTWSKRQVVKVFLNEKPIHAAISGRHGCNANARIVVTQWGRHFIYLFVMKFVQLGTQIKTRCEKKKLYKNTQKVHYAFIEKMNLPMSRLSWEH